MLSFVVLILISSIVIQADHFNGGAITWTPVNPNTNSSTVVITITQSYSWVLSEVRCDVNVPISTSNYANKNANLTCVAGCANQGGYSPINILTDCIWSSTSLDMMKSQRSRNVTLTVGAYFTVAYKGSAWRTLENGVGSSIDWSITSLIDVRRRPDGIINTPPVSNVASPQYVVVNRTTQFRIPVSDVNAGDDIRCRWAANPR